ncbi:acyl-CoA N-acyltransferase [Chytriomyces cf. hyalinus JEL632]|nr:acyl-CoA N-acyltransferase [Chytriomyces cf. hyalinus JEL632]
MPSFTIEPAVPADIPVLAYIAGSSFQSDRHTQMKMKGAKPYNHEEGMTGALTHWMDRPAKCTVLKVVDAESGAIAGWVCWAMSGYEAEPVVVTAVPAPDEPSQAEEAAVPEDPIERLEAMTNADMNNWYTKLTPPHKKVRFIASICVDPKFQSKGVGSMLITWGTSKADTEGGTAWVHASEAGRGMFAKMGFEPVGTLDVDLDLYSPAPADDGKKWGRYVFTYMQRQPRVANE